MGMTFPPPSASRILLASSATPVTIYGASGASSQTLASFTLKGGTVKPGSVLEFSARFDFPAPFHAGRTITFVIGGVTFGQAFPGATILTTEVKMVLYVAPDLQSVTVQSQNFNGVLSPTAGQGAPYASQTAAPNGFTLDLTQDQLVQVQAKPVNDDIVTLAGFALENVGLPSPVNYAPAVAVAVFANSLGAGTGSLGSFILSTTANTTNGSQTVTLGSTTGVLPGQVITGPGIPAGTILTGTTTISQAATATATGVAVKITTGAWPQQLLYASAGRPVFNNSIGGTTEPQISVRQALDKVRGVYWTQLWIDLLRNSIFTDSPATCVAGIAAMAARLAAGVKWAVGTTIPDANEGPGTSNWTTVQAANAAVLAAYPAHTVDVCAALTASNTVNIPLKYRACINTTGTISTASAALTVGSTVGLSVGMYAISPGSTAVDAGSVATAPTILSISGSVVTLSANSAAALSAAMVSFIGPIEGHLNDLGYAVGYLAPVQAWLTANGA